jgi:hemoglobin
LLVDFILASAGGPTYYTGRDMKTPTRSRESTRPAALKQHLTATLEKFNVPKRERGDVMAFISTIESDIDERSRVSTASLALAAIPVSAESISERC